MTTEQRSSTATVDATCYIERSKVREILIASDADNESTQAILQEVDALPIFNASDFGAPAQRSLACGDFKALPGEDTAFAIGHLKAAINDIDISGYNAAKWRISKAIAVLNALETARNPGAGAEALAFWNRRMTPGYSASLPGADAEPATAEATHGSQGVGRTGGSIPPTGATFLPCPGCYTAAECVDAARCYADRTCRDCGDRDPCDDHCPNFVEPTSTVTSTERAAPPEVSHG